MRNYNYLIMLSLLVYVLLAAGIGLVNQNVTGKNEQYYKVEINRIMAKIKSLEDIDKIDLAEYHEIQTVSYLSSSETDQDKIMDFYAGENGTFSTVVPLLSPHGAKDHIQGYLRFDYQRRGSNTQCLFWTEGALFLMEVFLVFVLIYLKRHLIDRKSVV